MTQQAPKYAPPTAPTGWTSWSPEWAPHVTGIYDPRRDIGPSGMPDPQGVRAHCGECGAIWQGQCNSGAMRQHISRFAALHLHRDALVHPPPHLARK